MSGLDRAALGTLSARPYDILVVGGGIYGATAAREAGLRGYRTALVERGDFGAGTSFNSLKIIHGGIRYVQHLDVMRLRASARERAFWRRVAPELVAPLDFTIPLTGYGIKGPAVFAAAAKLYTALSTGLRGADFSGAGTISATAARAHLGFLAPDGLTGGGVWRDGQISDVGRLQIAVLSAAAAHGVDIANHMEIEGFIHRNNRVEGATMLDRTSGQKGEITARVVLLCTGEATEALASPVVTAEAQVRFPAFARALNIVVDRQFGARALGLIGFERSDAVVNRGGRMYFLTPWAGMTVIGTHEAPMRGARPDTAVADFLEILNRASPELALSPQDVVHVYDGVIPADVDDNRTSMVRRRTAGTMLDHAADGAAGLISVIGVKYTTARAVAARAVDTAERHLGRARASPSVKHQSLTEKLPPVALAAVDPEDRAALSARMEHAMRHEMAVTLEDAIVRRMSFAETGALSGPDGISLYAELKRIGLALGLSENLSSTRVSLSEKIS